MKFLSPFLFLALTTSAFADYRASIIASSDTCKAQFSVELTRTKLRIGTRHYSCIDRPGGENSFEATGAAIEVEVRDQAAYFAGRPIGGVNDGIIKIASPDQSAPDAFSFVLYPLPAGDRTATLWDKALKSDGSALYFHGQAAQ